MATIAIYDRPTPSSERPDIAPMETIPVSEAEMLLLELGDPYCDVEWTTERVSAIEQQLAQRRSRLVQNIRARVLAQADRQAWEDWMDALFANHCSMSTELHMLDRILPPIRRAESDGRTVWLLEN